MRGVDVNPNGCEQETLNIKKIWMETACHEQTEMSVLADPIEAFYRKIQPALKYSTFVKKRPGLWNYY